MSEYEDLKTIVEANQQYNVTEHGEIHDALDAERSQRIAGDAVVLEQLGTVNTRVTSVNTSLGNEVIARTHGDIVSDGLYQGLNARFIVEWQDLTSQLSDLSIDVINNANHLQGAIDTVAMSVEVLATNLRQEAQDLFTQYDDRLEELDQRVAKYEIMLQDITMDSTQITMDNGEITLGAWTILSQAREWDLEIIRKMNKYQLDTTEDINQALEDIQNQLPNVDDIINQALEDLANAPIIKAMDELLAQNVADIDTVHAQLITDVTALQNEILTQAQQSAADLLHTSDTLRAEMEVETAARIDAIEREATIRAAQLEQEALDRSAEIEEKINNIDIEIDGRIDELVTKTNDLTDKIRTEEEARIADILLLNDGLTTERNLRIAGDTAVMTELNNYKVSNNAALANVREELEVNVTQTTANTTRITALDTRLTANELLAASAVSKAETALTETSALATQIDSVNASINGINTELGKKADATALNQLQAQVTNIDGTLTNTANAVTVLRTDLTSVDNKVTGNTSAISDLNTKQIVQDGKITQLTQDTTLLKNSLETIEDDLATKVDSTAFAELNTRVTTAENAITVQSQDLVRLENALDVTNAAVSQKADSSALTALTSEVTNINNKVIVNSNAITSLSGRVTTVEQGLSTKLDASVINAYSTTVDMNNAIASSITTYNANLVIGGENLYLGANPITLSGRKGELNVVTDDTGVVQLFKYLTAPELDMTQLAAGTKTVSSMEFFIPAATNNNFEFRFAIYRFSGTQYVQTEVLKASQFPRDKWFRIALDGGELPASAVAAANINVSVYVYRRYVGDVIRWRNLMMEKGTKASAYSEPTSVLKSNINANATAIQSTNASVTALDGRITSNSSAITSLNNRMTVAEGSISQKADASALSTLSTRVTNAENTLVTQGDSITQIRNNITTLEGKVELKADTAALNTLSNTVTQQGTKIDANSVALTKVQASLSLSSPEVKLTGNVDGLLNDVVSSGINLEPPVLVAEPASYSGSVIRYGNNAGIDYHAVINPTFVVIDPNKLYRLKYRIRRVTGSGSIYVHLMPANAAKTHNVSATNALTSILTVSSALYAYSGTPALGTWIEGEYFYKGKSAGATTGTGTLADPRTFPALSAYFRVGGLFNYINATGEQDVDYIIVEDYTAMQASNANATATQALTARVTTAEGTLTNQSNAVTKLQNDLVQTNTTATNADLLAKYQGQGKLLSTDPTFKRNPSVGQIVNYGANLAIASNLTRVDRSADNPTDSPYEMNRVFIGDPNTGTFGFNPANPPLTARANAVFLQKMVIKIPTGFYLGYGSNSIGSAASGAYQQFIGSVEGTGKFEVYYRLIVCGAEGPFSTTGHVRMYRRTPTPVPSSGAPVTMTIVQHALFDVTEAPDAVPKALWDQVTANATAIQSLDSKVTQQGTDITSLSTAQTVLSNRVTTVEGALTNKADASAVQQLDSRVTTAEGNITSNSTAITNLQNRVTTTENGLSTKADASALSALQTTVTQQGNTQTSQGNQITSLSNSLTVTTATADAALPKVSAMTGNSSKIFRSVLTYDLKAASAVGNIVIQTPITLTARMFTLTGVGYSYRSGKTDINFRAGAYAYSGTTLLNHSATNLGSMPITFRFGIRDGCVCLILTSQDSNQWSHVKIELDAQIGYTLPPNSWASGWTAAIVLEADLATYGVTNIVNTSQLDMATSITANASAITNLTNTVTQQGNTITSNSDQITALNNSVTTINGTLSTKADSSAVTTLASRVTATEGNITSLTNQTTNLTNRMSVAEGSITANTNALSTLDSKVTTIDGKVTSQATSLTKVVADLQSNKAAGSLANDYYMTNPDDWYSHYGYNMSQYFKTVTDGKVANTVFRKDSSNPSNCWNYSKVRLPADKDYVITALVRRPSTSGGGSYFTSDNFNAAGVRVDYSSFTITAQVPADNQWYLVTANMPRHANSTVATRSFGFALGHTVVNTLWELQGYMVQEVIPLPDMTEYAKAAAVTALDAKVTTIDGKVTTQATSITQLQTDVAGNTAAIAVQGNTLNGVLAEYTIKLDVNGLVAGIGIINTGTSSAVGVNADYFYIGKAGAGGKKPFMVLTTAQTIGGVTYPAGTWIDVALIANATIGTAHIANAAITTAKIADLAVTNAKILDLNATKITAGTIDAARIGAGSITADKMSVTELSAISANLGSFTTANANGTMIVSGPKIEMKYPNGVVGVFIGIE